MKALLGLCAVGFLSGCLANDLGLGFGDTGQESVFGAASIDEVVALGGVRLAEEDMIAAFSGATLHEPNQGWTWSINADNTQSAYANDGSWADDPNGVWQIVDDQFCRENEDLALWCSDVYQIGDYYRFTERDGSIAAWTVTRI